MYFTNPSHTAVEHQVLQQPVSLATCTSFSKSESSGAAVWKICHNACWCRRCWLTAELSWHWDKWHRNACTELFLWWLIFLCWLTWSRSVCWYLHELQIYCDYSHVICSVSLLLSDSRDGCCHLICSVLYCDSTFVFREQTVCCACRGLTLLPCQYAALLLKQTALSLCWAASPTNCQQNICWCVLHVCIHIQQGAIDSYTQTHLRAFGQPGSWK